MALRLYSAIECGLGTTGARSARGVAGAAMVYESLSKGGSPPKLLDRLRLALRSRHYSPRTERVYVMWVRRFIFFHGVRHPGEMAEAEINAFLTHLAVKENISASTQNQALSALLFLYRHVLDRTVGDLGDVIRARKAKRLPVVLTRDEVKAVLAELTGEKWLMASLLYGAGLRLMECLRLRVKDIDFSRNEIATHLLEADTTSARSRSCSGTKTQYDDDLHPCFEQGWPRRAQSVR